MIDTPFTNGYIFTATTTTLKSGHGQLRSITVSETAAGTVTVYDNTVASGTVIAVLKASVAEQTFVYDVAFNTGLTIVTAAASKLSVSYR